jgi:formate hydrogenlyase subunit 6/NADH:ubiquinone oxidoreductase subunit I
VIEVDRGQKKWEINRFGCCQCGECVTVCPKKCLSMENQYAPPGAGKNPDVFVQKEKPQEDKGDA